MPRLLPLLAAALAVAGCAGSQPATADAAPPTPDAPAPDVPPIQTVGYDVTALEYPALAEIPLPDVRRVTLPNGLRLLLVEDRELPLVGASALIGAGEVLVPDDLAGLAGVAGRAMRSGGTPTLDPEAVDLLLENVGAQLDLYLGETSGSVFLEAPAEEADRVLPVLADLLARPALAPAQVERAVGQAKDLVRRGNDASLLIVNREFGRLVYDPGSPYARQPSLATLDRIGRDDVARFHREHVRPESTVLSVWGDFDADHVEALLRDAFAGWEGDPGAAPAAPPRPTGGQTYSVTHVQKDGLDQSTVRLGYLGRLTFDDPDYAAVLVMNEVLSGGPSSRLFSAVRTEQGLAYSVRGQYWVGYRTPSLFMAEVQTASATTVQAARSVLREIERMREAPPTEAEVALARDAYLNSFVFNFTSKWGLLDRLMAYEYHGYPRDFLQQTQAAVAAVTAADVFRVSQEYLHPDRASVLVLGDAAGFSEPLSALAPGGEVREVELGETAE